MKQDDRQSYVKARYSKMGGDEHLFSLGTSEGGEVLKSSSSPQSLCS